ncbi:MFS transporter [Piscinibacter sakaiensis]|uniref:MFS transporter n=1 Tax=Piscinibacter sakaiensis TaxID=1547922 RepID=UPI003AAAFE08
MTAAAPPALHRHATLPVTMLVQAASSAAVIAPAVAAPRLLEALQLGAVAVGFYVALVYGAAAVSSQFGAALVRRLGPIRTSQIALLLSALGLLLVAVPSLAAAVAGALLIGLGYGPITPASSDMLARTTPPERTALIFSIKQTGVPAGGALAGLMVPGVLVAFGSTIALAQMALLCLAGIALAQWLRAGLDGARDPSAPLPSAAVIAAPVLSVLAHPILRRIALATLVFSTVQVAVTSYLVSFLTADLGWSLVSAGAALSISQAGGVVGRVVWGGLADRLHDGPRRLLLALATAMALAGVLMALLTPQTPALPVLVLLAIYGATAIGWNGVYLGTVARVAGREQAATATAGCLFFTYVAVVIGPPLFGQVGALTGSLGIAYAVLALPLVWTLWMLGSRWTKEG